MGPISNIDRLVVILRQRLQERAKAASRGGPQSATTEQALGGLDNVQAMALAEGVDDGDLGRALVQSILADHFGAEMLNEAKFQRVVERVTEAISEDAGGAQLLSRMLGELRSTRD